ncbi:hypothetical protein [Anaerobiospirillum thomasii]|uniref:Uncharacterized protein n=1 Tax=Anaerobiospirillum thomasii TaxID=179995 RepID=A0A2X0VWY1_9GAMM|nr:hypothetical protein [Anaerobiospirillum thomasii]SPT78809.1 Uncharacterised protein [Anaerobiospirillum thomasii]
MTVYKTLELNGIDTESYLRRLNNSMYAHCINKAMTRYYMDNGELPKGQIKSWDMVKLLQDFDYTEFDIFKN